MSPAPVSVANRTGADVMGFLPLQRFTLCIEV